MKYKRILIKLSGEALQGSRESGIDPQVARFIADEIKEVLTQDARVAVVVGGGNFYRGVNHKQDGILEETGHWMGMLAITLNAFALTDLFNSFGLETEALSVLGAIGPMKNYTPKEGRKILDGGKILILSGGTGKPYVTSDSGAAQRAEELNLDVIFKATKVDGVYDSDPVKNPDAKKFTTLNYKEVLEKDLKVMDREAFEKCQKNNIPIIVFKMDAGNIKRAAMGEKIGTLISN